MVSLSLRKFRKSEGRYCVAECSRWQLKTEGL